LLSCYRVLDLTNEKGYICGRALGDLGADVVKIEKPGGDPGRSIGPFYHDIPDPQKSLYWFAFNTNKRGITLDIETADGREIFKELVKKFDVVVESFSPGYMDELGLGYDILSQINPQLVMTSISNFGQEGPYRDYKASDIVVLAQAGIMYVTGDPDRPPLMSSYPHAFLFAAMEAAAGTMIALYNRALIGHGQRVDASAQQSLAQLAGPEVEGLWQMEGKIYKRRGRKRWRLTLKTGEFYAPLLWECQDGEVGFVPMLGFSRARENKALAEWIESEGMDSGPLGRIDLEKTGWSDLTNEEAEEIFESVAKFMRKHTRTEIYEGAKKRGLQLVPSLTMEERVHFPHLIARHFWVDVDYPELDTTITHPGPFLKFSETPCAKLRRAPLIGEHNNEVYSQELGLSKEEIVALKQRRVI
jgi:crotonobetainyl-CoA:carnitine CoA-transferase CaiB-like acyl-CoA transferase